MFKSPKNILSLSTTFIFTLFFSGTIFAQTTLNWVGCGISKKAYVTSLAEAFERRTKIHINIQGGGATRGIRDVMAEKADLGGSCRYRLPQNPLEAGVGLEPVGWDSLVFITHKNNPVDNITIKQAVDVFTGKINNWDALGGADTPIKLYTRKGKISGVGRTIRELIFANLDQEFSATKKFKSSGPLEKAIVATPNSLGVSGISSARLRDVKILKLNGVFPSYENVKAGDYQLYRPLYITYNPSSPKIKEIKQFISFCHSTAGRQIMKSKGTLPYRDGLKLVTKQIHENLSAFRRGAKISIDTND